MTDETDTHLKRIFSSLNEAQKKAVTWGAGPMLVLAGPGSGKTLVLTARLASILKGAPNERFRVLALTFTNMAAAEMSDRLKKFLGADQEDRTFIGTFHSFCVSVLRSHGSHIGLSSNFRIFGLDADRNAVLESALREFDNGDRYEHRRILGAIDRLRERLIPCSEAARHFRDPAAGEFIGLAYEAYERALREAQALDFPGLLMETWKLFRYVPRLAARYRSTYRYWLVDEFQDTNRAQYGLLRELAGAEFRNVFVVADDDQIIYRWNGASYQRFEEFRKDFSPEEVQLPTNYRCPPDVVAAANNLIRHNNERTSAKEDFVAGKSSLAGAPSIELHRYSTDVEERVAVAERISQMPSDELAHTVVLARSKFLLEGLQRELNNRGVSAKIIARRDDFVSAAYVWMQAVMRQLSRPQDLSNLDVVIRAFAELGGATTNVEALSDIQVETGKSLLRAWVDTQLQQSPKRIWRLVEAVEGLVDDPKAWREFTERCADAWGEVYECGNELPSDVQEDKEAWREISRDINQAIGRDVSLDEFLFRLDISSKEPSPGPDCVRLMTIHGAKGKEFKTVYLIGLAEGELPSWQSIKSGGAAELEEERRACYVAITRAEQNLILSYSTKYRNWSKQPSRFLAEMGLVG